MHYLNWVLDYYDYSVNQQEEAIIFAFPIIKISYIILHTKR